MSSKEDLVKRIRTLTQPIIVKTLDESVEVRPEDVKP